MKVAAPSSDAAARGSIRRRWASSSPTKEYGGDACFCDSCGVLLVVFIFVIITIIVVIVSTPRTADIETERGGEGGRRDFEAFAWEQPSWIYGRIHGQPVRTGI